MSRVFWGLTLVWLLLVLGLGIAVYSKVNAHQLIPGGGGNLLFPGGSVDPLMTPSGGSVPPPPTCSYSLDFSQSCNSQYMAGTF